MFATDQIQKPAVDSTENIMRQLNAASHTSKNSLDEIAAFLFGHTVPVAKSLLKNITSAGLFMGTVLTMFPSARADSPTLDCQSFLYKNATQMLLKMQEKLGPICIKQVEVLWRKFFQDHAADINNITECQRDNAANETLIYNFTIPYIPIDCGGGGENLASVVEHQKLFKLGANNSLTAANWTQDLYAYFNARVNDFSSCAEEIEEDLANLCVGSPPPEWLLVIAGVAVCVLAACCYAHCKREKSKRDGERITEETGLINQASGSPSYWSRFGNYVWNAPTRFFRSVSSLYHSATNQSDPPVLPRSPAKQTLQI